MARTSPFQTNFSAGEISPELQMRQDTAQYQNGAKSLRNMRLLIGGGATRRPGSQYLADLAASAVLFPWVVNQTTEYVVAFTDGGFYAFLTDGTPAGSIASCPWTGTIYQNLQVAQSGNTMFIVNQGMAPQVITRTGAATWSRSAYAFFTGPWSRPEQVYLKVQAAAVTLAPSALTGSITLTSSSAFFVDDHVGQYIRYLQKACLITAVAVDGLSCTATVIESLPPSQTLTVTSTASFGLNEVVAGSTSSAQGIVTEVTDATHLKVAIVLGLTKFQAETLVGPNGKTTISAVADATPQAVTDWDEQLFGPVYGYPGAVEIHRSRLLFGNHLAAPDYLIASVINNLYDFNVGTGADADAIIESIGDAGASRIVRLHSAEQLLILTDHGPYYVPETSTTPFRASSIAFYPFGSPWPITAVVPALPFDGGVLMTSGSLIIKAKPTGNLTHMWEAEEVSLLASHIVDAPTAMAVTSNFADGPERYAMFVNEDGTLAVMQLIEDQKVRNFTPWDTNGTVLSIAAIQGSVYMAVQRSIAGNTVYVLELLDQDLTLDAATEYTTLSDLVTRYGATAVNVVTGSYSLGTYPLSLTTVPAGPYTVGLDYTTGIETLPPVIEDREGHNASGYMRILEANIFVSGSARFAAKGLALTAYDATDDLTAAPPLKNGAQRFQFLGWTIQPTLTITQTDPLPLTVLGIETTVAH